MLTATTGNLTRLSTRNCPGCDGENPSPLSKTQEMEIATLADRVTDLANSLSWSEISVSVESAIRTQDIQAHVTFCGGCQKNSQVRSSLLRHVRHKVSSGQWGRSKPYEKAPSEDIFAKNDKVLEGFSQNHDLSSLYANWNTSEFEIPKGG